MRATVTSRSTWRAAAAAACAIVLVAACGGDDGDSSGATSSPPDATASDTSGTGTSDTGTSGTGSAGDFPLTITDAAGIEHTFDAPVTKIGCRYFGCIESLADMGIVPYAAPAGDEGVVFLYPDGEPAVAIQDFDNLEEWAAADVDVMVDLVSPFALEDAETLGKAAPVFFLNAPYEAWDADNYKPGVDAWRDDLRLLGAITGHPELADAALARYDTFVANLAARAPDGAAEQELANLSFTDDGTYSLMDPGSPFCEALRDNALGHCLEVDGWNAESWEINAEAFLAADPDWIAYTVYDDTQTYADRDDPAWGRLSAVSDGRVFDFSRTNCCSLRMLTHSLQEYAFHVWGTDGGVPDPGPENDFDPTKSPLATAE